MSLPRKRLQHVHTFEQWFMWKSSSMLECPGSDWRCVTMQNKSVVPAKAMWSEVAEPRDLTHKHNICRLKEDLWILLRECLVSGLSCSPVGNYRLVYLNNCLSEAHVFPPSQHLIYVFPAPADRWAAFYINISVIQATCSCLYSLV